MTKHATYGDYKPTANAAREAAAHQVELIRKYWLSKGAKVNVWIEPFRASEGGKVVTHYAIRSDIPPEILRVR